MRILRARNLLLIIVFVYAVMTILFCVAELNSVAAKVTNMRSIISLAADMSVSQALASDEFFNDTASPVDTPLYAVQGVTSIRTADAPSATQYKMQNIFSMVYGIDTSVTADADAVDTQKELLYERMFGKDSTSAVQNVGWMNMALNIRSPMESLTQYGGSGDLPNIARLGLLQDSTFAGAGGSSKWLDGATATALWTATKGAVVGEHGHSIKNMNLKLFDEVHHTTYPLCGETYYRHYNETSDWLHLFNIAKTYIDSNRREHTYYLAPTNVGITYLDPYILETAFVSNMDLLMRGEIVANGGTLDSGLGIVSNGMSGEAQIVDSDYVNQHFIINNGKFSFVKGTLVPWIDKDNVGGWTGGISTKGARVLPKIDYMCIDVKRGITDANVRTLIFLAVGLDAGTYHASNAGAAYEDWLESLGIDTTSTDPYYVMLARVTFYVDAFTSYNTTIARDLYSMFVREKYDSYSGLAKLGSTNDGNKDNDLFQVRDIDLPNGTNGNRLGGSDVERQDYISGVTGLPYYMYTTYYAVMP